MATKLSHAWQSPTELLLVDAARPMNYTQMQSPGALTPYEAAVSGSKCRPRAEHDVQLSALLQQEKSWAGRQSFNNVRTYSTQSVLL